MISSKNTTQGLSSYSVLGKMWFYISIVGFIGFAVAVNHTKINENDTWWHIALGRWMVQNHQIYRTEIFSPTGLGRPFIAHEWLSEIVFYLFLDRTGVYLDFFKLLVVSICTVMFSGMIVRPYVQGRLTFPLCISLAFLIAFRSAVRPQIFELCCSGILILILHFWQKSQKNRTLMWLVPNQILWTNLHGSYLLGPVFVFLFAIGNYLSNKFPLFTGDKEQRCNLKQVRFLFLLSLGLLTVALLNPFHWHLLEKSFSVFFLDSYIKEHIRE